MVSSRGQRIGALSLELYTTCHATEDCEKVRKGILNLLPLSIRDKVVVRTETIEGYYGNPITTMRVVVDQPAEALSYLSANIDESEKKIIGLTLGLRYDPKSRKLVIRFSKQDAYRGYLRVLDQDDVIKLIIHLTGSRTVEDVASYLKNVGLIL